MQELPDQRAERAARRDDRPFRAERPARADRDRRRSGLRNVIRGGNAALVEEHLLHRLGDAVPADGLRAVARHEPDDDAADHRDAR